MCPSDYMFSTVALSYIVRSTTGYLSYSWASFFFIFLSVSHWYREWFFLWTCDWL